MVNEKLKKLGKNIKAERVRKGLSQFQLAEAINMSERSVSKIECALQSPSALAVYDIAQVLKIDINELFKGI